MFEGTVRRRRLPRAGRRVRLAACAARGGGTVDASAHVDAASSSAYTAAPDGPARGGRVLRRVSPRARLAFGCVWRTADFPWMGIWEENHSRTQPPWNGETLTRGMEFGVSPMPESRRAMVDRGRLFGVPTYRWIPARARWRVRVPDLCRPAAPCRTRLRARASSGPPRDAAGVETVEWRATMSRHARASRRRLSTDARTLSLF